MIRANWKPSEMGDTINKWEHVTLPADGDVDAIEAQRFMVIYQAISEDWLEHFANAVLYKENAKFKRDSIKTNAFLRAEGKSDRQKESTASVDPEVRVADKILGEATAALKYAELRYDSAVRSHHLMKKVLDSANEERFLR